MFNTLGVLVNNQCNLLCDYCYVQQGKQSLSFDIFRKALKYFVSQCQPPKNIKPAIFLVGGEPLLNWSLLKRCIDYARNNFSDLRISLTTNGRLLDPDKFNFLKNNGIELTLSIDGPARLHDSHRKIKGSEQGSLKGILENIKQIPLEDRRKITINTVISPGACANLMARFLFIRKLGFMKIRFHPVFQPSLWKKPEIKRFGYAMGNFSREYCRDFLSKQTDNLFIIDALRDVLRSRVIKRNTFCCIESKLEDCNSIWLDPEGNFYICERVAGIKSKRKEGYKIGDVDKGINFSLRDSILSEAGKRFRSFLAGTNFREKDCFLCPFPFYFLAAVEKKDKRIEEDLSFYFRILRIYKKSFSGISQKLKDNPRFRYFYGS